jgi:hypothetical protein
MFIVHYAYVKTLTTGIGGVHRHCECSSNVILLFVVQQAYAIVFTNSRGCKC